MSVASTKNTNNDWIVPVIFLLNVVVYYITALPLMDDSDVPWHLATGRWLLAHHTVPTVDPWSYVHTGQPWYLLSWIWDTILGVIEQCFGLYGVLVVVLTISASIPALIAWHLLRIGVALPAIFFTTMLSSLCIMDFVTARPHLGGYVMALVFYLILHRSRPSSASEAVASPRSGSEAIAHVKLLWLPPLMLIWANMHGSFIAGFSVLAAYAIEAYATKQFPWLKRLVMITIACAVCAVINPYGLDVLLGAMKTLNGSAKTYTLEWLPFSFSASTGISAWLILFILVNNVRGSRAPIADKILATGWMIGTFFVMRNGPIFIILSAPYLAICLDEATETLREARPPSPFMIFMERQLIQHVWLASIAVFALFIAITSHLPNDDKYISEDMSVSDAINYAYTHYPNQHYLTDFNFGGQVIYRMDGKLPFFMDSRAATAYGDEALQDYIEFMWQNDGWEERMSKYDISGIMIGNKGMFAKAYEKGQNHEHWQLVFAGKRANVYIARP